MVSRASIREHPIHPMLIVFPIAFWIGSFVCDLIYHAGSHDLFWKDVAFYAIAAGLMGALLSAIPGFIDYLSLPKGRVKGIATTHMVLNLIVAILFVFNLGLRMNASPDEYFAVVLSAVSIGMMAASGWLGGTLVYLYGVGVSGKGAREADRPRRVA